MRISEEGIALIKSFEGCELKAYRDPVGIWTIGYGNTTEAWPDREITKNEADKMLKKDLALFEDTVKRLVTVPITQSMFDALVSFSFNLGEGNLRRSTLLYKLNKKQYAEAFLEFPRWNKAGGRVLRGLTRRRKAEQKLFTKDAYNFIHKSAVINR